MKTPSFTFQQIAPVLVRTSLGAVFIWASWDKIAHPDQFAAIIGNYDILPAAAINPAALALPWTELVCGLLLVAGRLVPGAVLTIDTLLIVFIMATAFNLYRGLDVNCGCFSVAPDAGGTITWNLGRDSLLLAAGIWLFIYTAGRPERGALRPPEGMTGNAG